MNLKLGQPNKPYPLAIRVLHWVLAIVLLALIGVGFLMTTFPPESGELTEGLYYYHKSFGILAFILVLIRISIRRKSNIDALPSTLEAWEIKAASVSHFVLYALMLFVPITGYIDSSSYAESSGVHFFFVDLPQLVPDSETINGIANMSHQILAYGMLAIVAVHAAGALKHRFFDKNKDNDVFPRISL